MKYKERAGGSPRPQPDRVEQLIKKSNDLQRLLYTKPAMECIIKVMRLILQVYKLSSTYNQQFVLEVGFGLY